MIITLTGASGLIGKALNGSLVADGHDVRPLGRRAAVPDGWSWDATISEPPAAALSGVDAVVHLLGEPIAQRWTAAAWRRIVASRVEGTRRLVETLERLKHRPAVLVSGSATGIYGNRGDDILTEISAPGDDRVARLCEDWEREAMRAESLGIRVVLLRTGLVLAPRGGVLARMLPAFRMGLGGPLGDGRQWMPWIHARDLVGLIRFALDHPEVRGPINGTAPEPVTNRDFTRALGAALRRPAVFPVPRPVLRILFGEMAGILTSSQRVMPEKPLDLGFRFGFSDLGGALADILRRG